LYRLLRGKPPPSEVPEQIASNHMHERSPDANVFEVPYFLKGCILSNEMCKIIVYLLHQNTRYRSKTLHEVRKELLKLRDNNYNTPKLLR